MAKLRRLNNVLNSNGQLCNAIIVRNYIGRIFLVKFQKKKENKKQ